MATIPESTGPRTPQEPPKSFKPKSLQRSESLISSQRIRKEDILQKPEHQVGKENLTPTRINKTAQETAKATSEMAKRVNKKGSFEGTIRSIQWPRR
ncbi:MAG: hypothetical protein LLG04_01570 [Parachlamydia sp.]|nr:hypothetical protein [Parachlamydia sp.]